MTDGDTPIRDPVSLQQRVGSWPPDAALALDTEFVRERTYYPKLCLIQAAIGGDIILIDVLAIEDGGALAPVLADPGRPKILHAARQDIEALLPLTGMPLAPVFDTQQAAALLGFSAAGRLCGARPAAPRRRARQGPCPHGLVATAAVAGPARLRSRRCPLPSRDRGGARRAPRGGGQAGLVRRGVGGAVATSRSIAWSPPTRGVA